jgi:hypothetical protein
VSVDCAEDLEVNLQKITLENVIGIDTEWDIFSKKLSVI